MATASRALMGPFLHQVSRINSMFKKATDFLRRHRLRLLLFFAAFCAFAAYLDYRDPLIDWAQDLW
jgi:hypothetical protein